MAEPLTLAQIDDLINETRDALARLGREDARVEAYHAALAGLEARRAALVPAEGRQDSKEPREPSGREVRLRRTLKAIRGADVRSEEMRAMFVSDLDQIANCVELILEFYQKDIDEEGIAAYLAEIPSAFRPGVLAALDGRLEDVIPVPEEQPLGGILSGRLLPEANAFEPSLADIAKRPAERAAAALWEAYQQLRLVIQEHMVSDGLLVEADIGREDMDRPAALQALDDAMCHLGDPEAFLADWAPGNIEARIAMDAYTEAARNYEAVVREQSQRDIR